MRNPRENRLMNQIKSTEEEAAVLLNQAMKISKAFEGNDDYLKLEALDDNLKLWVEIETTLKNTKNLLPEETKVNLTKLSKYVEFLTLSKGVKMSKSDCDILININMQISEGLLDAIKNFVVKEEAVSLLKCALDLSNAREKRNVEELVTALDNNMKTWIYLKTLVSAKDSELPEETKGNLVKLADYVSYKTLEVGRDIVHLNDRVLDSMIMTNLQITEGLLSNQMAA